MNVLVSGASGFIGSAVVSALEASNHGVRRLMRGVPSRSVATAPPAARGEFRWNPAAGELDPRALDEVSAVVHLGGENIASGR